MAINPQWRGVSDIGPSRSVEPALYTQNVDPLDDRGSPTFMMWQHSSWSADERTAIGEQRHITLPDGTQLILNTQSAVDVVFNTTQRLICLRAGEILITTAQDPLKRPLMVRTDQGSVCPVGARFSIRMEEADSLVAVFAGAVDIRPSSAEVGVRLTSGQSARFNEHNMLNTTIAASSSDWTQGILRVEQMPLLSLLRSSTVIDQVGSGVIQRLVNY